MLTTQRGGDKIFVVTLSFIQHLVINNCGFENPLFNQYFHGYFWHLAIYYNVVCWMKYLHIKAQTHLWSKTTFSNYVLISDMFSYITYIFYLQTPKKICWYVILDMKIMRIMAEMKFHFLLHLQPEFHPKWHTRYCVLKSHLLIINTTR